MTWAMVRGSNILLRKTGEPNETRTVPQNLGDERGAGAQNHSPRTGRWVAPREERGAKRSAAGIGRSEDKGIIIWVIDSMR